MAQQIAGLCRFVGTIDQLTFYKMDGQYYVRVKSSLSSERVKTSPEFKWTMIYARLLVRASKIGSAIYKALPPGWRQFWMYRSFTGEAFTLLKENPYTDEQVKQILWKCYVDYWEQRKAEDPENPIFQPKPKKIRKRRKYSEESIQRLLKRKGKNGKPKWRDPEEEERKRLAKERNNAAYARLLEKEKQQAEQEKNQADQQPNKDFIELQAPQSIEPAFPPEATPAVSSNKKFLNLEIYSTWHVTSNGSIQPTGTLTPSLYISEASNPPRSNTRSILKQETRNLEIEQVCNSS